MKQQKDTILTKLNFNYNKTTTEVFFADLYQSNWPNGHMTLMSFNNLTGLPFSISEKIFFTISKSHSISQNAFTKGMIKLYSESYLTRLKIIFAIMDFDNDHWIQSEDVKFILLHFHLITNKTQADILMNQVNSLFKEKSQLSFDDLRIVYETRSSDIVLLLLFFFDHYTPIEDKCVGFFKSITYLKDDPKANEKEVFDNVNVKKTVSFFKRQEDSSIIEEQSQLHTQNQCQSFGKVKHRHKKAQSLGRIHNQRFNMIEPSEFIYEYLNRNFPQVFNFTFNTSLTAETNDDSDLEDLLLFEKDITTMTSQFSMIKISVNNIANTQYDKRLKSCSNYLPMIEHDSMLINLKEHDKDTDCSFHSYHLPRKLKSHSPNKDKCSSSFSFAGNMSNNTNYLSYYCIYKHKDNDKEYKAKITLVGNVLFIEINLDSSSATPNPFEDHNDYEETYHLYKMIILKKVFISSNENPSEEDNSMTDQHHPQLHLISTLKGIKDTHSFIFNHIISFNEFTHLITIKLNHRKLEDYYTIQSSLGKGTSGEVKLVEKKNHHESYALKILPMNYEDSNDIQLVYNELDICKLLMQLNHPRLTKFYDYFETITHTYIIMEFLDGFTLDSFIQFQKAAFQSSKQDITCNLIESLVLFNYYGIIHRDIKPANIIISHLNDKYQAKIIDFGFAKTISKAENIQGPLGTFVFASPEIISNKSYSFSTDIWSFGVLLHHFAYGQFPVMSKDKDKNKEKDEDGERDVVKSRFGNHSNGNGNGLKNHIDKNIGVIVNMCLVKDDQKRASIKEINKVWESSCKMLH